MKKSLIISVALLLVLLSIIALTLGAEEAVKFNVSPNTTTPFIGEEVNVTIAMPNYSSMQFDVRGIQIDIAVDASVFEIISHQSLITATSVQENSTNVVNGVIRYVYFDTAAPIAKTNSNIMEFTLKVKDTLTESGTARLPITYRVVTQEEFEITDELTINYKMMPVTDAPETEAPVAEAVVIELGNTVADIKATYGETAVIKKADGTEVTTGRIGTGYTIHVGNAVYTAIVKGEVTGDGRVDMRDVNAAMKHLQGVTPLTDVYLTAACTGTSDRPSMRDINAILKIMKGQ